MSSGCGYVDEDPTSRHPSSTLSKQHRNKATTPGPQHHADRTPQDTIKSLQPEQKYHQGSDIGLHLVGLSVLPSPPHFFLSVLFLASCSRPCRATTRANRGGFIERRERKAAREREILKAVRMMCPISPTSLLKCFLESRIPGRNEFSNPYFIRNASF